MVAFKHITTSTKKVLMTESERLASNKRQLEYRKRIKEQNPELLKQRIKIQNRKYYLKRKQRLSRENNELNERSIMMENDGRSSL
tara:strand:+ start:91 stop:345 length:255 start_codon:yes stop_codon:yes gene_type:complete